MSLWEHFYKQRELGLVKANYWLKRISLLLSENKIYYNHAVFKSICPSTYSNLVDDASLHE